MSTIILYPNTVIIVKIRCNIYAVCSSMIVLKHVIYQSSPSLYHELIYYITLFSHLSKNKLRVYSYFYFPHIYSARKIYYNRNYPFQLFLQGLHHVYVLDVYLFIKIFFSPYLNIYCLCISLNFA